MNLVYAGYDEEPKLRLKENIRISKARIKDLRCAWCRCFLREGEYHFSINNVTTNAKKNFISEIGQPIHIHLNCIEPMFNRMKQHKLDNLKRLTINLLK